MPEMTPKRLAVVTAGLSQPSSTRLLADRLAEAAVRALAGRGIPVDVEVVELRDLAHDITDNLLTGFAPPALQSAIDTVTNADGIIAVTPSSRRRTAASSSRSSTSSTRTRSTRYPS
jgi:FMN reductase